MFAVFAIGGPFRFKQFLESTGAVDVGRRIYEQVKDQFDPWLSEYQGEPEIVEQVMNDPEDFLYFLNEYLDEHYNFEIREDGKIELEIQTDKNTPLIGNTPVVLYHHTTDALDDKIRTEGLRGSDNPDVKMVNPYLNSGSGVYVTTEYGGAAVNGYQTWAIKEYGGNPRTWEVTTNIYDLIPDPDDEDLESLWGRQFVLRYVSPSDLRISS